MKAKIEIEMDSDAFQKAPASELARILRQLANRVDGGWTPFALRDVNGNFVGTFEIFKSEED